jgi:alginate O-acetyltransferase complex protein AlgI
MFLPIVLAGAVFLRRFGPRPAMLWLIAASLFFYAWWDWHYLWVPLASILANYAVGLAVARARQRGADQVAGFHTGIGIALNLVFLALFKYGFFVVGNVNWALGVELGWWNIALPLGISFFTFQQIAYLVDVRRGLVESHGFVDYLLFVTFFPQLIAGPIVHHRDMMPQFTSGQAGRADAAMLAMGVAIFVLGLAKKVLIADHVSLYVGPVFQAAEAGVAVTFLEAWGAALAYSFQIYFDFSAYSDMAVGIGLMFGVRLPINFASPYKSTSIIEFWRRWHITLSRFLRDYLYIPLGGGRRGPRRRYANLLIVMLLGGLWHGAGWTFVIWGGLHGLALALNHAWRTITGTKGAVSWPARFAGLLITFTFTFVTVTWVLFRAGSLEGAQTMLAGMAGLNGLVLPETLGARLGGAGEILISMGWRFEEMFFFLGTPQILWLAGLLAFVWIMPNTLEWTGYREDGSPAECRGLLAWSTNTLWALALSGLMIVCLVFMSRTGEFLYFQF